MYKYPIITHEEICRKNQEYIIHDFIDAEFLNSARVQQILNYSNPARTLADYYILCNIYCAHRLNSTVQEACEDLQVHKVANNYVFIRNVFNEIIRRIKRYKLQLYGRVSTHDYKKLSSLC